jgi:hypothetical protein
MNFFVLAYAIVGAFVAAAQNYFSHVGTVAGAAEAVVAILIWPLLLLGVDVNFR